jgi:hypothetical protein
LKPKACTLNTKNKVYTLTENVSVQRGQRTCK